MGRLGVSEDTPGPETRNKRHGSPIAVLYSICRTRLYSAPPSQEPEILFYSNERQEEEFFVNLPPGHSVKRVKLAEELEG